MDRMEAGTCNAPSRGQGLSEPAQVILSVQALPQSGMGVREPPLPIAAESVAVCSPGTPRCPFSLLIGKFQSVFVYGGGPGWPDGEGHHRFLD